MQKCLHLKKETGGEFKQDFYFIFLIVTLSGENDLNLVAKCIEKGCKIEEKLR